MKNNDTQNGRKADQPERRPNTSKQETAWKDAGIGHDHLPGIDNGPTAVRASPMTRPGTRAPDRQQNPAVAAFTAQLREFYGQCGAPTYRSLAKTSLHLTELYPGPLQGRDLTPLSATAISEILNGRRAGLPKAAWVVAFVLSCQRRAAETGVLDTDPATHTVPTWIHRWQHAWTTTQTTPAAPTPPTTGPYEPCQGGHDDPRALLPQAPQATEPSRTAPAPDGPAHREHDLQHLVRGEAGLGVPAHDHR